jgi:hypothetical protein
MRLSIPLRVRGWRPDGTSWEEITQTEDVSLSGIGFYLRHPVALGQIVHLSLPLPKRFRQYDIVEATYQVYAGVRFVGGPKIGVMFLGKMPPRAFQENPSGQSLAQPEPQQARQFQRYGAMVNVRLRRIDAPPGEAHEEITVTEDVSQGGVRVLTAMPIAKGDMLLVEEIDGDFESPARVQEVSIGRDNLPRLGLMFMGDEALAHSIGWLRRVGVSVEAIATRGRESRAAAQPPTLRPFQLERMLFEECRENEHAICMTGSAAPSERLFRICTCECHEG